MAPYILKRWDEPHLFDALCALLLSRGIHSGEYGLVEVCGTTFHTYFPCPTELVISAFDAVYSDLEHEALMQYNELVDPEHLETAESIAACDPAMSGLSCRDVL